MFDNMAAWLPAKKAELEVKDASYSKPKDNEIVVRNKAVAINPVDWGKQSIGDLMFNWIKYPFILGLDLAGEVVEVGKSVTRFKAGDRILGQAMGMEQKFNNSAEGAFQLYTVVHEHMASPIPDFLSYEKAAVIPLCLSTAACGLFQKDYLALQYPTVPPKPTNKALLIWGGSTSVGCNAIQLAVSAGYEVITTASSKNFEYLKKLGASQVFDYHSKTVVKDIIGALKGKIIAGVLAIGASSAQACVDIIEKCDGNKFVAMASYPVSLDKLADGSGNGLRILGMMLQIIGFNISLGIKCRLREIKTKFIESEIAFNEVSKLIYTDFLPEALEKGQFIAAPDPLIIGKGLEYIQPAFDIQKKGVSAHKVVVSL